MTPEQMMQKLSRHFAIRFDNDEDQAEWLKDMSDAFKSYDRKILRDATQWLIFHRKQRAFPLIADIKEACDKVTPDSGKGHPSQPQDPMWSAEAFQYADKEIDCETGRRSAREGWCLGLHEFLRRHRRMPNRIEVAEIIETSRFVDRCAAGLEPLGFAASQLGQLASSILERRERLAKRLLADETA